MSSSLREVVVVGAGPAGAATALRLARAGLGVTIVERARFPRRKACGEYLGTGALAAIDRLGLAQLVAPAAHRLTGVKLFVRGGAEVELRFHRSTASLSRERLDAMILEAALAAGVQLVRGRVEEIVFENGRAAGVRWRDDAGEFQTIRARYVVGADGIGSIVARKLGLERRRKGRPRFAIGGHYSGFGDLGGFVEMYVDAGSYFAINPLGPDLANVMLVVGKSEIEGWQSGEALDDAIGAKAAQLGRGIRSFAGTERAGPRIAVGPLAHAVRSRIAPGAILIGDAGGFLDPFSGQGVFLALGTAERAAEALLAAFAAPAGERAAMDAYERNIRGDMAARSRLVKLLDILVDVPFLARRAARRLQRSPAIAETLLDALAGAAPPASAFRPAALARLLV